MHCSVGAGVWAHVCVNAGRSMRASMLPRYLYFGLLDGGDTCEGGGPGPVDTVHVGIDKTVWGALLSLSKADPIPEGFREWGS